MLNNKRQLIGFWACGAVFFVMASAAVAQPPTGGPAAENPVWYHWIAGYPTDYVYITDDVTYPLVTPSTVPTVNTSNPLAWENPTYWMDINDAATLVPPPNSTASWFIGSDGNPTTTEPSVTVLFTQDRDGNNGTAKVGGFAFGGGNADQVQTLIVSANMTTTGIESTTNDPTTGANRGVRIGRNDEVFDNLVPWGVVQQTHGLVYIEDATGLGSADLRIQADKDWISGAVWEVGGDASLRIGDALQVGDRGGTAFAGVTKGHGIFRVRGSDVGGVRVGYHEIAAQSGDMIVFSGPGRGDSTRVDYGGGSVFTKINGGKATVEFVLDQDGVTPVEVFDELRIGSNAHVSFFPEEPNPWLYAFLRVKLAAPTTAGSGPAGSADDLVLIRSDRIQSALTLDGVTSELEEGRFMDPDRDLPNFPHRPLLEGGIVMSDYAGATYSWTINYFDDDPVANPMGDGVIQDAVVLSNLVITGTPGDLNHDAAVTDADRNALIAAIAAPPFNHHDLLGVAQNLYDLNADDFIDNNDLIAFNTYFLAPTGLPGDFNDDDKVDAADYTVWRDNLGAANESSLNGNGDGANGVDPGDYTLWKSNFGNPGAGGGGASGVVPEPSAILLAVVALGFVAVRRRGLARP